MASKNKKTKKIEEKSEEVLTEQVIPQEKPENIQEEPAKVLINPDEIVESEQEEPQKTTKIDNNPQKNKKESKKIEKESKYKVGSIVFISKEADADLKGFKLFPQYKKYTYTVEAYDQISDVYTLRRLNLSLKLKSEFILAPDERAHDSINRKQY